MITILSMQNFKSWRNTKNIRLAPITAFFGSNSSGKTGLLPMLLMLKQTLEATDHYQVLNYGDERSYIEPGNFQDLIFNHDPGLRLQWKLEWQLPQPLKIENPAQKDAILFKGDHIGFSATVKWKNNQEPKQGRTIVERMAYNFSDHEFGEISAIGLLQ